MPALTVNVPVPVYAPVPPSADTVTVDDPPLQTIAVADEEDTTAVGSVTVTEVVDEHPLASVTITVYVPAAKFDAVADVPPVGDHK